MYNTYNYPCKHRHMNGIKFMETNIELKYDVIYLLEDKTRIYRWKGSAWIVTNYYGHCRIHPISDNNCCLKNEKMKKYFHN